MIGKTIYHYKILERIGQGGMGVVYKAEDTKLKRTVALKFLPSDLTRDPEAKERFINEAQTASALDHNNICTIYEINETKPDPGDAGDGQLFLAMACYDGKTLKEKIEEGQLTEEEAINIAVQIGQGLAKAHEKGIVHRDIKPANIMITDDGVVKILDFGLAKLAGQTKLTKSGSTLGTVAYMSPEQSRGEQVDHRTDIWSLGILFYEMLAGQLPYKGEYEHAIIYSIINEDAELLTAIKPDISPEIASIVEKALTKESDSRYQQANDLLMDVKKIDQQYEKIEISGKFSFFSKLYQKRIPQILGVYFIFIFLFVQFVDWITERFLLSPHLVNFILLALLSLTPALVMLAYFRKVEKQQSWFSIGKLGVSLNLVASIMLLFMGFSSKDLTFIEEVKQIEDEDGNSVPIKVPKAEFCKSIAVFPFENTSGDTSFDWLQRGIDHLLYYDLGQEPYLFTQKGYDWQGWDLNRVDRINKAGYPGGIGIPLNVKMKITKEIFKDYFLSGSFSIKDNSYLVKTILHKTKNGNIISENTYRGNNLFKLIDSISVQIRYDIEIPSKHIEESKDLPVSEILTKSIPALKEYILGYGAFLDDVQDKANFHFKNCLILDSTFVDAYYWLGNNYLLAQNEELCKKNWTKLMRFIDKIPDLYQFKWKMDYYGYVKHEFDRADRYVEERAKKFPNNLYARMSLASFLRARGKNEKAISEYMSILDMVPEYFVVHQRLGVTYRNMGDFNKAIDNFKVYKNNYPDDYRTYTDLGVTYRKNGELDSAKKYFNDADFYEPENILIISYIAYNEMEMGNFEQALKEYQKALSLCKTSADSSDIYLALAFYYYKRGQIKEAFKYRELHYQDYTQQPIAISQNKIVYASDFIKIGETEKAFQVIENIENEDHPSSFDRLFSVGKLVNYLELGDADNAEKHIKNIEENYSHWNTPIRIRLILHSKGKVHELRNEYDEALIDYQEILNQSPIDAYRSLSTPIYVDIGRVYRKLKDYKNAEEALQKTLKVEPYNPEVLYEMALIYWEWNKKEKALENLNKCLYVWENADAEYIPAQKAREKIAEWEKI